MASFGSVKLIKTHKGLTLNGKKINCAYCHTVNKIPKKGTNYKKYNTTATCAGPKCHDGK